MILGQITEEINNINENNIGKNNSIINKKEVLSNVKIKILMIKLNLIL